MDPSIKNIKVVGDVSAMPPPISAQKPLAPPTVKDLSAQLRKVRGELREIRGEAAIKNLKLLGLSALEKGAKGVSFLISFLTVMSERAEASRRNTPIGRGEKALKTGTLDQVKAGAIGSYLLSEISLLKMEVKEKLTALQGFEKFSEKKEAKLEKQIKELKKAAEEETVDPEIKKLMKSKEKIDATLGKLMTKAEENANRIKKSGDVVKERFEKITNLRKEEVDKQAKLEKEALEPEGDQPTLEDAIYVMGDANRIAKLKQEKKDQIEEIEHRAEEKKVKIDETLKTVKAKVEKAVQGKIEKANKDLDAKIIKLQRKSNDIAEDINAMKEDAKMQDLL